MATLGVSRRCATCGRKVPASETRCPRCGGLAVVPPVRPVEPELDGAAPVAVAVRPATAPDSEARAALLQVEIDRLVRQGYRVVSQTPTTAQLVKAKRFHFLLFLVTLLLFGLGLLYLFWYVAQRDSQVYLRVDEDGRVHRS